MRAAAFDRYGGPEVLHLRHVAVPVPKPHEVLVRVTAATVNGGELHGRAGRVRLLTGRHFPQGTGIDFVGEIVTLGQKVTAWQPGDHVWGVVGLRRGPGTAAEYVTVPAASVHRAPRTLRPVEAVSLLTGGGTALYGLRDRARVRPGERLLIRGAAGGVGSVAVQIGARLGAHVTALAHPRATDFLHSLGAEEVVDYHTELSSLGRYDVVFDTRGTRLREARSLLEKHGRMVTIAFDLDHPVSSLGYLLASNVHGGRRVQFFFGDLKPTLFDEVAGLADRGDIRPVVDTVYPLERISDAHARLEAGGVHGKLVLDPTVD